MHLNLAALGFRLVEPDRSGGAAELCYSRLPPRGGGKSREGGGQSRLPHHGQERLQRELAELRRQLPLQNILLVRAEQLRPRSFSRQLMMCHLTGFLEFNHLAHQRTCFIWLIPTLTTW